MVDVEVACVVGSAEIVDDVVGVDTVDPVFGLEAINMVAGNPTGIVDVLAVVEVRVRRPMPFVGR